MQLKFKYNTQEEIPVEYKEFYVQRDGAWCVDVQGATDTQQVEQREAELCAERNALQGECEALTAKLAELQRVNHGAGAAGSAEDASAHYNNPFRRWYCRRGRRASSSGWFEGPGPRILRRGR